MSLLIKYRLKSEYLILVYSEYIKKTRNTPNLQIREISFLTHSSISKGKIIRNLGLMPISFAHFSQKQKEEELSVFK